MLDSLQDGIPTDRLSVPVPKETSLFFDPQRDIGPKDWLKMESQLKVYTDYPKEFARFASYLKILDPSRNLEITENDITTMKNLRDSWHHESDPGWNYNWSDFVTLAPYLKIIDPNIDLTISDHDRWRMETDLVSWRGNDWENFTAPFLYFKILDPDIDLKITDTDREIMKTTLNSHRRKNLGYFIHLASNYKIFDPHFDFGITVTDWKEMREELTKQRGRDWDQSTRLASSLAILSAKNITFDSQGMHLIFEEEKKVVEKIPPVPRTLLNS